MKRLAGGIPIVVVIMVVVVVGFIVFTFSSQFFYLFEKVEQQEVGVQFQSGSIHDIVGPGVYSDFGLYVDLKRVSSQAIPFNVEDDEIITKDKQRMGVVVSGDIFRPNLAQKDTLQKLWAEYSGIYLDDELAKSRVQALTQQAMKVCVGDRNFNDNVVGTARDTLRNCIDDELNLLAGNYGLHVENVVVPDIVLSPEVQASLDAIVQSRLSTEKAAQDKLKADAEASAEQARQEGEIRVQQSRIQEEAKQQTLLAKLEQERVLAQKAVIEAEKANELAKVKAEQLIIQAQKANELISLQKEKANELARVEAEQSIIEAQKINELLAAQKNLEINRALAEAATEKAKADLASQLILAELYADNPGYLELQKVQANANALQPTDKIIFTPEGTVPNLVFPGPGIVPTVDTTPQAQP